MHAFGMLHTKMAATQEYQKNAEMMIQQFIYKELESNNAFLRTRACWVYAQFAEFPLGDEHLKFALNLIYQNLAHKDLPVRVEAAVALIRLMYHEQAVNFVRPALGTVIQTYLKLIDDIDYDELIESLRTIVDVFNDEIQPYAEQLCTKLGESFCRLIEAKNMPGEELLELDTETCLTADGLMTAIRRILYSITGKFPQLFQRLEQVLQQPISMALFMDRSGTSVEDALTCLAILLYNQSQISPLMWQYFEQIISSLLQDNGVFDQYLDCVIVVLINFLNKAPQQIAQVQFTGQQMTHLQVLCSLIAKIFELSEVNGEEFEAVKGVLLTNAILENVKGQSNTVLPGILDLYLKQLQSVETPDLEVMILQGIMVALWYDTGVTL